MCIILISLQFSGCGAVSPQGQDTIGVSGPFCVLGRVQGTLVNRQQKNDLKRDAIGVAARAVGLSYGPSECRRQDADEHMAVVQTENATETQKVVPVQWILTRNRGILEQPA